MKMLSKTVLVLLAAALLLPFIGMASAQVPANLSDQVEKRPAERAMEELYKKGMGWPWAGGEPFGSDEAVAGAAVSGPSAAIPHPEYRLIGFLNTTSGIIIASDTGSSLLVSPGQGSYPVYAYFEGDTLSGIFIDFNSNNLGI
ncbi:MAG TPA: hypothetical protein PKY93_05975 [Methanothrix sp.]|nr:hypothetical protein [Methanothrix sp.]HRT17405.1 hypothetical protein [Methanothrix sp.]